MTDEELLTLIQRNKMEIAKILLSAPRISGDQRRVKYKAKYHPHNLLMNTFSGDIVIADDVMFGPDVMLLAGTHDSRKTGEERVFGVPKTGYDITIEEGVWVATGSIILGPCRIGKHAVIGAGSLVRGDVPAYAIYAGNPAKKIGEVPPETEAAE
jgi:acetyltransferase-like isoleucine patch superfamily enzyme